MRVYFSIVSPHDKHLCVLIPVSMIDGFLMTSSSPKEVCKQTGCSIDGVDSLDDSLLSSSLDEKVVLEKEEPQLGTSKPITQSKIIDFILFMLLLYA